MRVGLRFLAVCGAATVHKLQPGPRHYSCGQDTPRGLAICRDRGFRSEEILMFRCLPRSRVGEPWTAQQISRGLIGCKLPTVLNVSGSVDEAIKHA
jgi:hypothetical protein